MGPFGIEPVDIGGIIQGWRQDQSARIQQMLAQRQIDAADRQAERDNSIRTVLARAYGGGTPGAGASAAPSPAAATAPQAGAAQPAAAAPRPQGNRDEMFRDLLAIDPQTAFQYMRAFNEMDEAQFNRVTRTNGALAREAYRLQSLPPDQRRAALRQAAPQLMQMGLSQEQLDGFDPTDENLGVIINQATDLDDLASRARPDWMNIEGELLDRNALARGEYPVRFRSQYMTGPAGIYERPNAGLVRPDAAPQPAEPPPTRAGEIRNGYRYRGGPLGDPNSWEPVQGGPSQPATGGFP